MNNRKQTIFCVFVCALVVVAAVPVAAHAGTMTIHNQDCAKRNGLQTNGRFTVHVYDDRSSECTDKMVRVDAGRSKTVSLKENTSSGELCLYKHLASGIVLGARNVPGNLDSSVTCRENLFGACQCTKD